MYVVGGQQTAGNFPLHRSRNVLIGMWRGIVNLEAIRYCMARNFGGEFILADWRF